MVFLRYVIAVVIWAAVIPSYAKIYHFQHGDNHVIYSDQDLTNVRIRKNGYLIWRNGTIRKNQYIEVRTFFRDKIQLDASEWSGWWYQAPSVESDAGYYWTLRGLESGPRYQELNLYRKRHPEFPK